MDNVLKVISAAAVSIAVVAALGLAMQYMSPDKFSRHEDVLESQHFLGIGDEK